MTSVLAPLTDITNIRQGQHNIVAGKFHSPQQVRSSSCESTAVSPEAASPLSTYTASSYVPSFTMPQQSSSYRHDPYNWKCLPENDQQAMMLLAHRSHLASQRANMRRATIIQTAAVPDVLTRHNSAPTIQIPHIPREPEHTSIPATPTTPATPASGSPCRCLVQFKCHQAEYSSHIALDRGQYVVVQGDRGMDIGVVIRVNTEGNKTFIERTGPCGSVMRHATQREVDYWASELKADEATALDFCRHRVLANDLVMEVRHAEYQFDKKKLTFYYDAKSRVDFVTLLKELYREYGCRIWMEKVRANE